MKKSLLSLSILFSILFSACSESESPYIPAIGLADDYYYKNVKMNLNGGTYNIHTVITDDNSSPDAKDAEMDLYSTGITITTLYGEANTVYFYNPHIPIKVHGQSSFITFEGSYEAENGVGVTVEGSMTSYGNGNDKQLTMNVNYQFPPNELEGKTFEINVDDESIYPVDVVTHTKDEDILRLDDNTYTPEQLVYWLFKKMNADFRINSRADKMRITFAKDNRLELEFGNSTTGVYHKSEQRRYYIVDRDHIFFHDTAEAMAEISPLYSLIDEDGIGNPLRPMEYSFHQFSHQLPDCDAVSVLNMSFKLENDGTLTMTWPPHVIPFPILGWWKVLNWWDYGNTNLKFLHLYSLCEQAKIEMTPVAIFHEVKK